MSAFETAVTNLTRTFLNDIPAHIEWHGGTLYVHDLYEKEAVNLCAELQGLYGNIGMGRLGETNEWYFDFKGDNDG